VVNSDKRLEKRKVKVRFSQHGYAVIKDGLKPGERIVISDLITATEGLLLEPQEDKNSRQKMVIEATGKVPEK